MSYCLIPKQLWIVDDYFDPARFKKIKNLYRKTRMSLNMCYDDRVLSSWEDSPDLQEIVREETDRISEITGLELQPQVAYVSLDLSGSAIMMHRLHPDIFVQMQISMGDAADMRMGFAFCVDREINEDSSIDYRPSRPITRQDVALAPYQPNVASIYVNDPRSFVGMLGSVPNNSVREVLVLSYTRAY